ncbi:recombinase family protein [Candidatus Enterococcus lemimoniae]|uniref:Resolvase/invertase-type recombinase catalytic domain-containing protein n=1 Tax=Candidatus Enterococcus lemimoniae TaxID=1834167 RepID=A0ABZ2T0Q3_9ENTE
MKLGYLALYMNKSQLPELKNQLEKLTVEKIFIDSTSNKDVEITEFQHMLELIQPGDEVIFLTLDHLGKNNKEIRDRVIAIHSKKARLKVIDAEFLNFHTENQQFNELGFQLFVDLLEEIPRIKKVWNKERQLEGIQRAKEKKVYKGRQAKYSKTTSNPENRTVYFQIKDLILKGVPTTSIQNMTGANRMTIYRIKKELES